MTSEMTNWQNSLGPIPPRQHHRRARFDLPWCIIFTLAIWNWIRIATSLHLHTTDLSLLEDLRTFRAEAANSSSARYARGCQSFLIRSSEWSSGEQLWVKVIWRRFRRLYLWLLFKFHCVDLIIKFCYCKYLLNSPKTTRSHMWKTTSISIKRH